MEAAAKIDNPTIKTFNDPDCVFISECFMLVDRTNCRNDVYIGGHQLLQREYDAGNVDDCIDRIVATRIKLNRWIEESKNCKKSNVAPAHRA